MIEGKTLTANRIDTLGQSFYFFMSLLVAGVVVYGFSQTINEGLIHPSSPRPLILYFHAPIFAGWVVFFLAQSALIRTSNVRLHRQVGWFGLAFGLAMPFLGIATAIAMARFNRQHGSPNEAEFLIVLLFDMIAFATAFGLAFYWRTKPEFHRRLMLIATCSLAGAAFARFHTFFVPHNWFYAGVDVLILFGVTRDLIVTKRIHSVYLYGLPAMMLGQIVAMHTYLGASPVWLRIAHRLLG
ncbi:MAG: hypothetical protein DMG32_15685 [Acidobacteria bacterium]|nr:MAG: hypothetical protein DMG32_15685 [Acidobacteriota bacterium]